MVEHRELEQGAREPQEGGLIIASERFGTQGEAIGDIGGRGRLRLDQSVVARGLAATRSRARDLIVRGAVSIDGAPCAKPGQLVPSGADLAIMAEVAATAGGAALPTGAHYVSRGALKLVAALDHFGLDPAGVAALDVGASTGGFTQVLLERGAASVTAVDVGRSQLAPMLRDDPRVTVLEGLDARRLDRALLPGAPRFISADVSFISLTLALGPALGLAAPGAHLVALVKPQFEAGRAAIGKGGIVRAQADRDAALARVRDWVGGQPGWRVLGTMPSPMAGKAGNAEFLLAAVKDEATPHV